MSRKASRTLINRHHQLVKQHRKSIAEGDKVVESVIAEELSKLGGLEQYQQASLQGQSIDRGGDTSKILLEWLPIRSIKKLSHKPRMLEVGSLSTHNTCSTSGIFDMVHIDLKSQEPGIVEQDFMHRPVPNKPSDKFDIISLSLVLNFIPDAEDRGRMLLRTILFLRQNFATEQVATDLLFPSLFLVLPRSCVDNSRYFTESRLESLMESLGYSLTRSKKTQKLSYSLWVRAKTASAAALHFPKLEVNPGRTRNNFSVTLIGSAPAPMEI
ncbi:25S rRNA (adenine2142-N1)-methyltransferase [Conoideocrella luteorostrata]|uniref:25S rRNA adenine-N(1) methyltransferase n=1 Tax=Conoideocrella luteorostrata TaxID=1105319 RepID=A0AAJ0CKB8_9HYPO|nr:25S rRNA (adenine2142-N1)-methyltransferase [Conoideocrella luteorostrata]